MVANVNDCNSSDAVLVLDEHIIVKFICDRLAYVTGVYKILDSLRIFSRGKFLSETSISYFGISYFIRSGFFDLFIIYDMLLCPSVHTHFLVNWCC